MKTLRKNTLARVIGIGLAIGLASPVIAREAPQQQQEDARHDQDKGKHPSHPAAQQAAKPSPRNNPAPLSPHRPDPRADEARQHAAPQAQQQRLQQQQRADQQRQQPQEHRQEQQR